jgi:hypothetical protein
VRVRVPEQQHQLEEHHAQRPHDRRAAEPRQDLLASSGWTRKEEKALRKTVAACSGIGGILAWALLYTRPRMVARYIRFQLFFELAAYVAITIWLHFLFQWNYALVAALCIGAAVWAGSPW